MADERGMSSPFLTILYLVLVGVVITAVMMVILLLHDAWQLIAILIVLALVTVLAMLLCGFGVSQ